MRAARLASALAASRAELLDTKRDLQWHTVRAHERGGNGGGRTRVVLARADGAGCRAPVHLDRRCNPCATCAGVSSGPIRDLGNRGVAPAYKGGNDRKRRGKGALWIREFDVRSDDGRSVRAGATVSGDAAVAEFRQAGRRKSHVPSGMA